MKLAVAAKNIAEAVGIASADYASDGLWDDSIPTATNSGSQRLWVFDVHTPIIETAQTNLTLEALNFGGLWYERAYEDLIAPLSYYDTCGREVALTNDATPATSVPPSSEHPSPAAR